MRPAILLILACYLLSCHNAPEKTATNQSKDTARILATTTNETPKAPVADSVMMQNWKAYMTPGKEHQMLKSFNGTWVGELSMWMSPGSAPTKSIVTATNKMILGGRYQVSVQKGMFNGMPYEGQSITGFDNARKNYIASWVDNMGTGIIKMEGPWNETTKTIELRGTEIDPGTGKEKSIRESFRIMDNDRQIMAMFETGEDGKENKVMEILYTRKK
jgi:hypothetical protein